MEKSGTEALLKLLPQSNDAQSSDRYLLLDTTPWSSKRLIQHHSTLLLTEFGNDSKDVLEDIGCVQHEVLL